MCRYTCIIYTHVHLCIYITYTYLQMYTCNIHRCTLVYVKYVFLNIRSAHMCILYMHIWRMYISYVYIWICTQFALSHVKYIFLNIRSWRNPRTQKTTMTKQTGYVTHVYTIYVYVNVRVYSYTLGCNNGGGDGNFSKVKRLVAKWIWTRKRLF